MAEDPGAGKTIMAGLLIKELIARGDVARCFVACAGSLAEQWPDELYRRFQLPLARRLRTTPPGTLRAGPSTRSS